MLYLIPNSSNRLARESKTSDKKNPHLCPPLHSNCHHHHRLTSLAALLPYQVMLEKGDKELVAGGRRKGVCRCLQWLNFERMEMCQMTYGVLRVVHRVEVYTPLAILPYGECN
ncbi:hypothetical protein QVD17_12936 [Tagetes erecta]|uniref:Uncharacterized protein n=1 Tax=Tagetes erecta TaxID=13708 RepID=A0AAD8P304_TARER|nr:hypothetical protein QVD17_12936 [Tagetes erecta]